MLIEQTFTLMFSLSFFFFPIKLASWQVDLLRRKPSQPVELRSKLLEPCAKMLPLPPASGEL